MGFTSGDVDIGAQFASDKERGEMILGAHRLKERWDMMGEA
jgi:hypothetical protein